MTQQADDTAVLDAEQTAAETVEDHDQSPNHQTDHDIPEEDRATVDWLEEEFPEWDIELGVGQTLSREDVRLWVARREGHHPQSERSAGKLYSRLTEYMEREEQRFPSPN